MEERKNLTFLQMICQALKHLRQKEDPEVEGSTLRAIFKYVTHAFPHVRAYYHSHKKFWVKIRLALKKGLKTGVLEKIKGKRVLEDRYKMLKDLSPKKKKRRLR